MRAFNRLCGGVDAAHPATACVPYNLSSYEHEWTSDAVRAARAVAARAAPG